MHFGFALDLSDKDLLNIDLLDQRYTHLYLLVSKTSWRRLQDMSSRRLQNMSSSRLQDMSSKRLEDFFSVTIFHLPRRFPRCLQDVFKMSSRRLQDMSSRSLQGMPSKRLEDFFSVTIFRLPRRFPRCLQDVFKMSSRRLQDVLKDEKLLRWRRAEDVLKTCIKDVLKTSWRPTNVCWV